MNFKTDNDKELEELIKVFVPGFEPNQQLADPSLIMFYRNLGMRDLYLDSEINWGNCSFIIQYIRYLNFIEKDIENPEPLNLHIMSHGGEVPTMFALYNTVKTSRIPIHTINEGTCHSAAFIIFLGGKIRTMRPDACFVAHEGSGGIGGTYRESKSAMENYEKDVNRMREIIAQETNLTAEEIETHFSKESDWYIRYEEAKNKNIITE